MTGVSTPVRAAPESQDVVPIDWDAFATVAPSADAQRLAEILTNTNRYALTTWFQEQGFEAQTGEILDLGGTEEHQIRPVAAEAFALATALGTGSYDAEATGVSEERATELTVRLIAALAGSHQANDPQGWSTPDVGQRGGEPGWQSGLWAAMAAFAGWLVWEQLPPAQQHAVRNMVEYEADRFVDYDVPYWSSPHGEENFPGDTKAEENSWNAMMLQVATAMMPAHEHWDAWTEKNLELLLSAHATPSDLSNAAIRHGRPIEDWVAGWNVDEHGIARNHGIVHPDYMATAVQNLHASLTAGLAGLPTPQAALHHVDLTYEALVDHQFDAPPYAQPGGTMYIDDSDEVYYPEGTTWGDSRRMHMAAFDVLVGNLGLDQQVSERASRWQDLHAGAALAMQERHADGRTYGPGDEDPYAGREEWVAMHAAWAHLSTWLTDRNAVVIANTPVAGLRGVDVRPPRLSVTLRGNPSSEEVRRGPVTLIARASDESVPVRIEYRTAPDAAWQAYSAPLRFTRSGEYLVQLRATDSAGNTSPVQEVAFSRP